MQYEDHTMKYYISKSVHSLKFSKLLNVSQKTRSTTNGHFQTQFKLPLKVFYISYVLK